MGWLFFTIVIFTGYCIFYLIKTNPKKEISKIKIEKPDYKITADPIMPEYSDESGFVFLYDDFIHHSEN